MLKKFKLRAKRDQNYTEKYAEFSRFLTANYRHVIVSGLSNKMFYI